MSSLELPNLDDRCGRYFTYRDFIECSTTWHSTRVNNVPMQIETYAALRRLTTSVLEPVTDKFGQIRLTYGLSCRPLISQIKRNISPKLDQHASHELSAAGKLICKRRGAACDFLVEGEDSLKVAQWLVSHTPFDRLYYYGQHLPIHVSASEDAKGQCVLVKRDPESFRVLPSVVSTSNFLKIKINEEGEE